MADRPGRLLPEAPRPSLPALAGIRGLACVPVLLFHVSSATPLTQRSGTFQVVFAHVGVGAVMVFMWMSGYLILAPILSGQARGRPVAPPGRFTVQRVMRLYPVYWFVLVAAVVATGVDSFDPGEWLLMLSLGYVVVPSLFYRGLIVSWTLAVDMAFYLVVAACLPVLGRLAPAGSPLAVVRRAQRLVLGTLVGIAVVASVALLGTEAATGWEAGLLAGAPAIFLVIFTGAVVAYLVDADRLPPTVRLLGRTPWLALLIGGGLLMVACIFPLPPGVVGKPSGFPLTGVLLTSAALATVVLLPAVTDPAGTSAYHRFLGTNVLRWLGEVSYGVYLWQIPVLHVVQARADIGVEDLWWAIPVTGAGTLALAIPTYVLVETPVRDAVRRRLGARQHLAATEAGTRA